MNIEKLPNGNLKLRLDGAEAALVRALCHEPQSSADESKFIQAFLEPPGFREIKPEQCGALTDAPLIIRGTEVWGFMDYQVTSFLVELLAGYSVEWQSGGKLELKDGAETVYKKLQAAGVPLDSHESDLYAKVTRASREIVRAWDSYGIVRTFTNQQDGELWFDLPFQYDPFWQAVAQRSEELGR